MLGKLKSDSKFMKRIQVVLTVFLMFSGNVSSQVRPQDQVAQDNCEEIYGTIDLVAGRIQDFSDKESVIVILAGSVKARDNRYDLIRIKRLVRFLTRFRGVKPEQVVWGIGPASDNKFSYMRFYANGKLLTDLTLNRRSVLCTGEGEALPQ
jgi:hypothetical protein